MKKRFFLMVIFAIPFFSNGQTELGNVNVSGWLLVNKNGTSEGSNNCIYFGTSKPEQTGEKIASNRQSSGAGMGPSKGLNFITNNLLRLAITNDGKVGIGTANPKELLSVNGTMLVKDVKISPNGSSWPDYVFKEDYSLRSLENLDAYIKKNKHLPGFPSEKEIEHRGYYNLNEITVTLLKTVEELTLDIISLNEQIKTLEKEKL